MCGNTDACSFGPRAMTTPDDVHLANGRFP